MDRDTMITVMSQKFELVIKRLSNDNEAIKCELRSKFMTVFDTVLYSPAFLGKTIFNKISKQSFLKLSFPIIFVAMILSIYTDIRGDFGRIIAYLENREPSDTFPNVREAFVQPMEVETIVLNDTADDTALNASASMAESLLLTEEVPQSTSNDASSSHAVSPHVDEGEGSNDIAEEHGECSDSIDSERAAKKLAKKARKLEKFKADEVDEDVPKVKRSKGSKH